MTLEYWKRMGASPMSSAGTIMNVGNTSAAIDASVATQSQPTDIPFAEIGTLVGGVIGFGAFVWTYPIVWLDGPLPIIDALWLGGLTYSTIRFANMGRRTGQGLDTIEEALL